MPWLMICILQRLPTWLRFVPARTGTPLLIRR
nr:MAG TPA: hypothetical protein [Caudoviricetes sp.]